MRSFTQAASILNVSQPALTVQIRRFEETLGVKLFDRDTRSVELTRVARDLLPAFQRSLQDLEAALGSARDIASQARGVVRLAALPSVSAGVLPDAILRFREVRPNVVFDLKDVIAGQVLNLVQSEEVDFGVMGGTIKAPDVEVTFEAQDRLHVVYPRGHRIARLKSITPAALSAFPLILMQRDTSVRGLPLRGPDAQGDMRSHLHDDGGRHGPRRPGARHPSRLRPRDRGRAFAPVETDRRPVVYKTCFHHQEIRPKPSAAERDLS